MSRRAVDYRIVIGDSRLLRRLWNTVDVGHEADHRLSRAVARNPGGRHSGHAALDAESVLLQKSRHVLGCLVLLESKLAEAEDLIDHLLGEIPETLDFGQRLALQLGEIGRLLSRRDKTCRVQKQNRGQKNTFHLQAPIFLNRQAATGIFEACWMGGPPRWPERAGFLRRPRRRHRLNE